MSVTGDMPVGVVLLAPLLPTAPARRADRHGSPRSAEGPLIVTFVLGGPPRSSFQAFGMEEGSRVGPPRRGGGGGPGPPLGRARHPPAGRYLHPGGRHHQSATPGAPRRSGSGGNRAGIPPSARGNGSAIAWLTGQKRSGRGSPAATRALSGPRRRRRARPPPRDPSCAGTSTSASPTRRRAPSSAPYTRRGVIAAPASISSSWAMPTTVVQALRRYRNMGFDYVMVRHIVGDHQLMLRSFERIGRAT